MKNITVTKSASKKIRAFFPWIYRNEIKKIPENIKSGELIRIYSHDGEYLGTGYINPQSNITARILSFRDETIDGNLLKERISHAVEKRRLLIFNTNAYRLIHSEADQLPGVAADFYDGIISLQINTAGMEWFRNEIINALIETIKPSGIIEKSDENARKKEGLSSKQGILFGNVPEKKIITENNAIFCVNLFSGQKTGFYLDQRANRQKVSRVVKKDFRVLDLFSGTGGFGIYCGLAGAGEVSLVEISRTANIIAEENAKLNNLKNARIIRADAFDFLRTIKNEKYDLIVMDPPPFTKNKFARDSALRGMNDLILNSLKILAENGFLAVFSCSQHIATDDLVSVSLQACGDVRARVEVMSHMYQDADHPYILNIPSSLYLKGLLLRKINQA
jgi:23S rRNA (cytosine1962-C5)-methyltransferase